MLGFFYHFNLAPKKRFFEKHKNYTKHINGDMCGCWLHCMGCDESYQCRDFYVNKEKLRGKEDSCQYCWIRYGKKR